MSSLVRNMNKFLGIGVESKSVIPFCFHFNSFHLISFCCVLFHFVSFIPFFFHFIPLNSIFFLTFSIFIFISYYLFLFILFYSILFVLTSFYFMSFLLILFQVLHIKYLLSPLKVVLSTVSWRELIVFIRYPKYCLM